jgi:hypothetical protein
VQRPDVLAQHRIDLRAASHAPPLCRLVRCRRLLPAIATLILVDVAAIARGERLGQRQQRVERVAKR